MRLTDQQLMEQLHLQDQLNGLVNLDWRDAGNNWTRAMMVEGVELLDHYGWKWWKHHEPDMAQARIELVDIWHFILSYVLEKKDNEIGACVSIAMSLDHPENVAFVGYKPVDLHTLEIRELIEAFVALSAGGVVSITAFEHMMRKLFMSWDELHRMFIAKNVLNIFRQTHGYKDGTYIKVWVGKEDNEVLQGLIDARPDVTAIQLFAKLESIYSQLPKEST